MDSPLLRARKIIDAERDADDVLRATATGLMAGYDARWRCDDWQADSLEETFRCPIVNPETGRKSRTFTQAGKFDGIVKYMPDGRKYLLEHKTTSEDLSDPNSPYFRRLAIDSQVSSYLLAHWQNGEKLDGTVYDVIKKPGIRPKKVSAADKKKLLETGQYWGMKIDNEAIDNWEYNEDGDWRETPELFSARLAADTIEHPEKYFARRVVHRLDNEILEWAEELWDTAQDIRDSIRTGKHYRNSGSCMQYNRPCDYLSICSGHDTVDSDHWRKRNGNHSELDGLGNEDHRKILTHSQMRCFATCRRKHYYRYELGIEKEEVSQALYFGDLFHRALEAWWSYYLIPSRKRGNHDDSIAISAIEAGSAD